MKSINYQDVLNQYSKEDNDAIEQRFLDVQTQLNKKIIVLDDDPTGVQTVHDINVYTNWDQKSIEQGFDEENSMFYILTNSRGCTENETINLHQEIAKNIIAVSKKKKKEFILISRSDSTLRGHYPIETEILKKLIETTSETRYDGEIIVPFFAEGGRFTINGVHYVKEKEWLIPVAETEFSKDKTFGYENSNLAAWIEEKTKGEYLSNSVEIITLKMLRERDYNSILTILNTTCGFNKIIVDALDYDDIKVFTTCLIESINEGKNFMFRTAASFAKIIGSVSDKDLLSQDELFQKNNNGGVIVVGSHVKKTTEQIEFLQEKYKTLAYIEFDVYKILSSIDIDQEINKYVDYIETHIKKGITTVIYTTRKLMDTQTADKEKVLMISVMVSEALTQVISKLSVRPRFIVAKGGITSSVIGTKGLGVHKAKVVGQIIKGVPVWQLGSESKYPNLYYVIFPGNVGEKSGLAEVLDIIK
jgi:uncharacterized protein YgbK (DUF1537 family)